MRTTIKTYILASIAFDPVIAGTRTGFGQSA